jgi:hypothetical protein
MSFFRQEVSSSLEELDELHRSHPWIPGPANIRPVANQIAVKTDKLADIRKEWSTLDDYVLYRIFGYDFTVSPVTNKFCVTVDHASLPPNLKKLVKNQFPYQDLRCNHSIMWYTTKSKPYDSLIISRDIEDELKKALAPCFHSKFQFVWYENPKMTIPEFYHVHVFWI